MSCRWSNSSRRYDYAKPEDFNGISEECRIDRIAAFVVRCFQAGGRRGRAGVRKILMV